MTATQRTIAELIGWAAPHDVPYHECVWCGAFLSGLDGPCDSNPAAPTADDLLAWLSKTEGGIELFYTPSETTVYLGFANFYAPTLLAALDAAVRAVAGES